MDEMWIPQVKSWRLNERMYGGLEGLNKSETAALHGEDQVKIWRRSYDIPPPKIEDTDERYPGKNPRYHYLTKVLSFFSISSIKHSLRISCL